MAIKYFLIQFLRLKSGQNFYNQRVDTFINIKHDLFLIKRTITLIKFKVTLYLSIVCAGVEPV